MDLLFIDAASALYPMELDLRFRLLRGPLGMPRGSEVFEFEDRCLHLVAVENGRVIACVMFHPTGDAHGRLLQMAVDTPYQGRGLGRRLVRTLEAELVRRNVYEVELHARDHAVGFYERLGYTCFGGLFHEVGIPHRTMRRQLAADP